VRVDYVIAAGPYGVGVPPHPYPGHHPIRCYLLGSLGQHSSQLGTLVPFWKNPSIVIRWKLVVALVLSHLGVKNQIFITGNNRVLTDLERVCLAANFTVLDRPRGRLWIIQ